MSDKLAVCWKCLDVHRLSDRVPVKGQSLRTQCPKPKCAGKTTMGLPTETDQEENNVE